MKTLQLDQFTQYRFLSGLTLSPDGRHAAFTVRKSNLDTNGYDADLFLLETRSGQIRQLTGMGDAGLFVWLDDATLLFSADRGKKEKKPFEPATVFHRLRIDGGEAIRAFSVPMPVTQIQPVGEGRYILSALYDPALDALRGLSGEEKTHAVKALEEEKDYTVFDEIPFWSNGEGITNQKRVRLYSFDSAEESLTPITGEKFSLGVFKVSRDKRRVVYAGTEFIDKMSLTDSVWFYDVAGGGSRELLPESIYSVQALDFVDEGVLMIASEHRQYGVNENCTFSIIDAQGHVRRFADPDIPLGTTVGTDCRLGGGQWLSVQDNTLFFITTHRACARLCRMTLDGKLDYISQAEGSVDCIALSGDACWFVGFRGNALQELYRLDLSAGGEQQLSRFNEDVLKDTYVADPQPLGFVNSDGVDIDGWVLLPKDYDPNQTYPAILDIHGGPKTVYGTIFYHEMQFWANQGYFVLFSNPRGGDGRGNAFADIRGQYGGIDYQDLMAFTDYALGQYPAIDPARLGVTGGSYGGFMTNWIIGHTGRFAAAAAQRSISNWISKCCTTDIGYFFQPDQLAATPWSDVEKVWAQSPLKYADRCKTPTLFIHSDEDYRCWQAEAIQMFTALKIHGVASRLCLFKGENHELSRSGKPKHRIRRLKEITDWFEKYLNA